MQFFYSLAALVVFFGVSLANEAIGSSDTLVFHTIQPETLIPGHHEGSTTSTAVNQQSRQYEEEIAKEKIKEYFEIYIKEKNPEVLHEVFPLMQEFPEVVIEILWGFFEAGGDSVKMGEEILIGFIKIGPIGFQMVTEILIGFFTIAPIGIQMVKEILIVFFTIGPIGIQFVRAFLCNLITSGVISLEIVTEILIGFFSIGPIGIQFVTGVLCYLFNLGGENRKMAQKIFSGLYVPLRNSGFRPLQGLLGLPIFPNILRNFCRGVNVN